MFSITNDMIAYPTVFAVSDHYQIFIPFNCSAIVWIKVGNNEYYDDSNGILRSHTLVHKIKIPMKVLDEQREYTVVYRKMVDRQPYYPISENPICLKYKFRPVTSEKIKIYHISDAHNLEEEPIAAAKAFGSIPDILVLNGDIPNHSGEVSNFNSIYRIASEITKGESPVIFARGNHDTRGLYAEKFAEYTPDNNGKPYYTFKLGNIWGMVLDCGEDKLDSHPEYGGTVCFHNFRLQETEFIKSVIQNAVSEYQAEDVKHKIIICHIPFTKRCQGDFDIEYDLYEEWNKMIFRDIKPELVLFGHTHKHGIFKPEGELDGYRLQTCDVVVGGEPNFENKTYIGCGVILTDGKPKIIFNDNFLNIIK